MTPANQTQKATQMTVMQTIAHGGESIMALLVASLGLAAVGILVVGLIV